MPDEIDTTREAVSIQQQLLNLRLKNLKTQSDINAAMGLSDSIADKTREKAKEMNKSEGDRLILQVDIEKHLRQIQIYTTAIAAGARNRVSLSKQLKILEQEVLDLSEKEAELAKKISEEKKKHITLANVLSKAGLKGIVDTVEASKEFLMQHPILIMAGALAFFGKAVLGVFKEMDEAAATFRKTIGATRPGTAAIETDAKAIAFDFAHVGVTIKDAYSTFEAVSKSIGTTRATSKEMATDMALMQAQLGIATQTSAEFLKTMGMVGGTTMNSQRNMLFFTQAMTEAVGIPLDAVMSDVASASKTSYQFLSKDPLVLVKAAVEARKMGTSLEEATTSAKTLIDFTSNIRAEMEASVLLGKAINLQKAREFSYSKNIEGLNSEILRIAKDVNFNQLDPLQQDAVAKAFGKTSGQIAQILQADKEWRNIEAKAANSPELKEQLDRYKAMTQATKDRAKLEAESVEHQLSIRSNQAAIASITQSWHAIVQRLSEKFLPAIAVILQFIGSTIGLLNKSWVGWVGVIIGTIALLGTVLGLTMKIASAISGALGKGIGKIAEGALKGVARGLKALGAAAASPTTWLGIAAILALGAAILGVSFGISLILKALPKAAEGFSIFIDALGKMTFRDILKMTALSGAMGLMLPVLLPFSVAASAAGLGFSILGNGLQSTVSALKDLSTVSFFGLIKQTHALSSSLLELSNVINDIPQIDIEKVKAIGAIDIAPRDRTAAGVPATAAMTTDDKILKELQDLRTDLRNGGIPAILRIGATELKTTLAREANRTSALPGVRTTTGGA